MRFLICFSRTWRVGRWHQVQRLQSGVPWSSKVPLPTSGCTMDWKNNMCGVNGNTMEIFRKNLKSLIHEKNLKSKISCQTPFKDSRRTFTASWSVLMAKAPSTLTFSSVVGIGTPSTPSPLGECVPPSFGWGGGGTHSLAGEGAGGVLIQTRVQTLWYSKFICTLRFAVCNLCCETY